MTFAQPMLDFALVTAASEKLDFGVTSNASQPANAHRQPSANRGWPLGSALIAISKQRGSHAVSVAADVIARAEQLVREALPADMELVVTRNAGLTADEKVNELVDALAVALVIASFLPLFAFTGMTGPSMSAMALGVPVAMSMLVAFTITPWLAYHVLGGKYRRADAVAAAGGLAEGEVPRRGFTTTPRCSRRCSIGCSGR